ncbi:hypothetical protein OIU78_014752 [Salix suchowensis]|nr:hypothetical protein OIU78_014752 [Salix suchowensis]
MMLQSFSRFLLYGSQFIDASSGPGEMVNVGRNLTRRFTCVWLTWLVVPHKRQFSIHFSMLRA